MGIVLGPNQYGKAENRVVRIDRDNPRHVIHDLNVSTALRGDFAAAHTSGDQAQVLPTDTQKNTVFAYAKSRGVDQIEEFALTLGRHFVDDIVPVTGARVEVEEYAWERIEVDGKPHDHSFVRNGQGVRTTIVTVDGDGHNQRAWVVSGVRDLTVLKSTGSEFAGFLHDRFTTLKETHDRVMATSLRACWRYGSADVDWRTSYDAIRATMLATFASVHSLALQQTLYAMGKGVLESRPEVVEIRLSAPNIHHFVYDLDRFGLENAGEVFHVADRPYGLVQASVLHDDAPEAGRAWDTVPGFC
ncbi:MAG: urate oxidase [Propionibacteriales bacterium]|nr:urate oxidase [Propionibacteriales bacterium]